MTKKVAFNATPEEAARNLLARTSMAFRRPREECSGLRNGALYSLELGYWWVDNAARLLAGEFGTEEKPIPAVPVESLLVLCAETFPHDVESNCAEDVVPSAKGVYEFFRSICDILIDRTSDEARKNAPEAPGLEKSEAYVGALHSLKQMFSSGAIAINHAAPQEDHSFRRNAARLHQAGPDGQPHEYAAFTGAYVSTGKVQVDDKGGLPIVEVCYGAKHPASPYYVGSDKNLYASYFLNRPIPTLAVLPRIDHALSKAYAVGDYSTMPSSEDAVTRLLGLGLANEWELQSGAGFLDKFAIRIQRSFIEPTGGLLVEEGYDKEEPILFDNKATVILLPMMGYSFFVTHTQEIAMLRAMDRAGLPFPVEEMPDRFAHHLESGSASYSPHDTNALFYKNKPNFSKVSNPAENAFASEAEAADLCPIVLLEMERRVALARKGGNNLHLVNCVDEAGPEGGRTRAMTHLRKLETAAAIIRSGHHAFLFRVPTDTEIAWGGPYSNKQGPCTERNGVLTMFELAEAVLVGAGVPWESIDAVMVDKFSDALYSLTFAVQSALNLLDSGDYHEDRLRFLDNCVTRWASTDTGARHAVEAGIVYMNSDEGLTRKPPELVYVMLALYDKVYRSAYPAVLRTDGRDSATSGKAPAHTSRAHLSQYQNRTHIVFERPTYIPLDRLSEEELRWGRVLKKFLAYAPTAVLQDFEARKSGRMLDCAWVMSDMECALYGYRAALSTVIDGTASNNPERPSLPTVTGYKYETVSMEEYPAVPVSFFDAYSPQDFVFSNMVATTMGTIGVVNVPAVSVPYFQLPESGADYQKLPAPTQEMLSVSVESFFLDAESEGDA